MIIGDENVALLSVNMSVMFQWIRKYFLQITLMSAVHAVR